MSLQTPHLKTQVLQRITKEQICPRSRWFFRSIECVVWTSWFVSVLVGAVAIAVTLYAIRLRQYDFFEITHDNSWWLIVDTLPYLWLATLVVVVWLAVYNVRRSNRGYRYALWLVLGSSILASLFLGSVFHLLNVGFMVDRSFGQYMPTYPSQIKYDEARWQQPDAGRLIGRLYVPAVASSTLLQFIDMHEVVWVVETRDLLPDDQILLVSQAKVRLLGVLQPEEANVFHACGVFPWMMDGASPVVTLESIRQQYIERLRRFKGEKSVASRSTAASGMVTPETNMMEMAFSPCAELTMLRRM